MFILFCYLLNITITILFYVYNRYRYVTLLTHSCVTDVFISVLATQLHSATVFLILTYLLMVMAGTEDQKCKHGGNT